MHGTARAPAPCSCSLLAGSLVMLRPESSSVHAGTTAVFSAGVLFVLFGGTSVATNVYFGRRPRPRPGGARGLTAPPPAWRTVSCAAVSGLSTAAALRIDPC